MLEDGCFASNRLAADKLLRPPFQGFTEAFEARFFHTQLFFGLAARGQEYKEQRENDERDQFWVAHDLLFPNAGVAFSGTIVHRKGMKYSLKCQNKSVIAQKETA